MGSSGNACVPRERSLLMFPADEFEAVFQRIAEKTQDRSFDEVADNTEVIAVPQQIGHSVLFLSHPDLTLRPGHTLHLDR